LPIILFEEGEEERPALYRMNCWDIKQYTPSMWQLQRRGDKQMKAPKKKPQWYNTRAFWQILVVFGTIAGIAEVVISLYQLG